MKRIISLFLLIGLAAVATPALADTKTHDRSRVSFWVPDDWTISGEDRDQFEVVDPADQVALLFAVREGKDIKAALAAIDKTIATMATDVKAGPARKVSLNGMEASVIDATGKVEGKPVELSVLIIKTPAKHYLTVLGVLETQHKKAHEANLKKIVASFKPVAKFGK